MRIVAYLLSFFAVTLVCCQVLAQDADDAKKLQGPWEITELIVGGKKVADKDIKGLRFVFTKDKLSILPPPADTGVVDRRLFSFKLDPKAKPAGVVLTALDGEKKGSTSPGIYELKGDTLRWCQSDDPEAKGAPKEFASPANSSFYLFTFKRAK